ncbi:MAG: hypothetical protein H0X62_03535 [Bacteroidetes bacterium]|nr:hypothetical protein [Bacteroidota bacterium]
MKSKQYLNLKYYTKILFIMASFVILVSSCKKEKEEAPTVGKASGTATLKMDGKTIDFNIDYISLMHIIAKKKTMNIA